MTALTVVARTVAMALLTLPLPMPLALPLPVPMARVSTPGVAIEALRQASPSDVTTDALATRHELTDNRATLVLRDNTHIAVTLYLNYLDALHRALAPSRTPQEFALSFAAMPLAQLQVALSQAHGRFAAATRLAHAGGGGIALSNWGWPDAARVQAMLRAQAMQTVVAPDAHVHEQPTEIRAEAIASAPINAVTLRFPQEFQRVLVVSYKPNQVWVDPTSTSPRIIF